MEEIKPTQQQEEQQEVFYAYVKMDPYLAQWLIHETGGKPVEFPKNSLENDIIALGLTTLPEKRKPDLPGEGKVPIVLPNFKYKDVRYYNYLPTSSKEQLLQCLRARFVVALWKDLFRFGYIGKQKQDLIWTWMETHGIEDTETNFNAILKIYARKRDAFRKQLKRTNKKS